MKKKIIIGIISIITITVSIFGINLVLKNKSPIISYNENVVISENNNEQTSEYSLKTIILKTDELKETYGAINVEPKLANYYILKYESEEQTQIAYENFKKNDWVQNVELDQIVTAQGTICSTLKLTGDKYSLMYTNSSGNIVRAWGTMCMGLNNTEELLNSKTNASDVVVAVIDTGLDVNNSGVQKNIGRIDTRYYNVLTKTNSISDEDTEVRAWNTCIKYSNGWYINKCKNFEYMCLG